MGVFLSFRRYGTGWVMTEQPADNVALSLVSTDDLCEEIMRRADHGGVVLMFDSRRGPTVHEYRKFFKGNSHTIIGLLTELQMLVLAKMITKREPIEEEDDG